MKNVYLSNFEEVEEIATKFNIYKDYLYKLIINKFINEGIDL